MMRVRRGGTAVVLMSIAAACIVAPVVADLPRYRPPRRARRAADDPRFADAKAIADSSSGSVVFCKMNLIIEVSSLILVHLSNIVLCFQPFLLGLRYKFMCSLPPFLSLLRSASFHASGFSWFRSTTRARLIDQLTRYNTMPHR